MGSAVAESNDLSVHVFRVRSALPLPRAHLRRSREEGETIVTLPFLEVVAGPPLSERETVFLLGELQRLIDAWQERNG
jgi:hypothetical protein